MKMIDNLDDSGPGLYQKYDSQDGGGDIDNGVDAIMVSNHGFPGCLADTHRWRAKLYESVALLVVGGWGNTESSSRILI